MAKIVKEKCTSLHANWFFGKRHGNFSIKGPVNVGGRITPNHIALLWCWNGPRYAQSIERVWLKSKNGSISWFICPGCGTKRHRLYLPPGQHRFLCADCLDLTYEAWGQNGSTRQPKGDEAWLRWFDKKTKGVLEYGNLKD